MTSFAYQGFGFGEFFKAQQKLQEILEACFHGVFDAPSGFLSLARTLEGLGDRIERLFDENSNPNSALLRPTNKPQAQQMLRIASHGLIESLRQLEKAIPIQAASREPVEMRGFNIVMHLELSGDEHLLEVLRERFAFQSWKLDLFFRVLRKKRITHTLQVYDGVQKRIGTFFEELAVRKSTASNETMSSTGASEISGVQDVDIIQKFQDSCEFGSGGHQFIWKLKPESTLLITLHWVFHLSRQNDPKNLPVEAYVNLMKCSWLLRVTTPEAGVEGFSDEMRTMIGLLGCDVVYQLQEYFEKNEEPPLPSELLDRGDFNIFIDGINRKDIGVGLVRTAAPSAFPSESPGPSNNPRMNMAMQRVDDYMSGSPFDRINSIEDGEGSESARSSMERISLEMDRRYPPQRMPPFPPLDGASGHSPTPSQGSFRGIMAGMPEIYPTTSHLSSRPSTSSGPSSYTPTITSGHSGHITKKARPMYSWNEKVDRENLGVRPGEAEILSRDFETMQLSASYTGDKHGRWDACRLRIFKIMEDKTLRILTLMEGLEESIDQRVAYVKEAELVPDYGYHQNHPIIYIRKTHKQDPFLQKNPAKAAGGPMPPSSLYYKFRSAHDMFNFQFALLGEAVEADFQAVRTVRFKKSSRDGEHSHYKARIQLWREPEEDLQEVLISTPTVAPEVTRANWQRSSLKVHTTRIVMYWDETITTFFITDSIDIEHRNRRFVVRIRPSSYKAFANPTSIKARTFGSRDQPGGFRLDKKGLFPDDEASFDDFRWFEIEFNNQVEMDNFYAEFKRALNIRRKERCQAEELSKMAARGITAGDAGISLRR